MPWFAGMLVTEDRRFGQGQVTETVENFMACKFVGETQSFFVDDAIVIQQDRIAHRTPEYETLFMQLLELAGEAEGACRRNFFGENAIDQIYREAL